MHENSVLNVFKDFFVTTQKDSRKNSFYYILISLQHVLCVKNGRLDLRVKTAYKI